ncbi:Hypothetical protein PHPALM_1633 [Phytophthora palmivora]|uniref:Uncharacterized protein n=1 Tax=Phytophthora palmivora TaxID=4796 RepID=A0A2P4YRS4_9STRA|nr:Hypothetical protein PHPALM_1633 [Phytophthora palmivora]
MELADKLNYPSSGYQLKAVTGLKIYRYQRDHALGDSEVVSIKIIRDNKSVINFPKTNNTCVFHYIVYHKREDPKKDPRKIQALVKQAFKQYCAFKDISFTLSLYRNFKPIDILQFDDLEDCFKLNINVYTMDIESGNVECIRRSENEYDSINILSHKNHALYINNIDMLQRKYQYKKCNTVFVSSDKLCNHTNNRDDPEELLQYMFQYIAAVGEKIQRYNVSKYESLLRKIINAHGLTRMVIPDVQIRKKYNTADIDAWIKAGDFANFFDFHKKLGYCKQRSDYGKLKQTIDQVPVLGFNSGRYDINFIKKDLFVVIGTANIKSAIKNPSYMYIATSEVKMLDISN